MYMCGSGEEVHHGGTEGTERKREVGKLRVKKRSVKKTSASVFLHSCVRLSMW